MTVRFASALLFLLATTAVFANAKEVSGLLEAVPVYEHQFLSLAGPSEANLIETVTSSIANLNTHVLEPERTTVD